MLFLFILTKIITISINFLSKVSGFSLNLSKTENQLQIIEWIKEPNYFFMSVTYISFNYTYRTYI